MCVCVCVWVHAFGTPTKLTYTGDVEEGPIGVPGTGDGVGAQVVGTFHVMEVVAVKVECASKRRHTGLGDGSTTWRQQRNPTIHH